VIASIPSKLENKIQNEVDKHKEQMLLRLPLERTSTSGDMIVLARRQHQMKVLTPKSCDDEYFSLIGM
jgi:hypothetical protein